MHRTFSLAFAVLVSLLPASCKKSPDAGQDSKSPSAVPQTKLDVFAAASLTESFTEIGKRFSASHPHVAVSFNFAGSQQLRAQLENGAPADVFASANPKEMDAAIAASLVKADGVHTFATNRLVVIVASSAADKIASLVDLKKEHLKIDLADPTVPVGKYTRQTLAALAKDPAFGADFEAGVLRNIVSKEDNVKSVLNKVRLGEADAGVVYQTDVTPEVRASMKTLEVPDPFNPVADYPIGIVAKSPHPDEAKQFVTFVLSDEGQEVLRKAGFGAPGRGKP